MPLHDDDGWEREEPLVQLAWVLCLLIMFWAVVAVLAVLTWRALT